MIVAALAVSVSGCASDSTAPSPTTVPPTPTSVLEGPGLPDVEPGTNLDPMMDDPPQNEEADVGTSQMDPGSDG